MHSASVQNDRPIEPADEPRGGAPGRGTAAGRVALVAQDLGIEADWKKIPDEVMGIGWAKAETRRYPPDDPRCQGGDFGYPRPEPPPGPPPRPPPEPPDTG